MVEYATGSITSTNATTDATWIQWTSTTDTTFRYWVDGSGSVCTYIAEASTWPQWSGEVDERRSRQIDTRRRLERDREQRPIRARARELLRAVLDDEQWADWRRHGSVRLTGSDGGRYEVGPGWAGMIYELCSETDEPRRKLCCHPPSHFPVEDRVATLVLALQADEAGVLAKANVHAFYEAEKQTVAARRAHREAA